MNIATGFRILFAAVLVMGGTVGCAADAEEQGEGDDPVEAAETTQDLTSVQLCRNSVTPYDRTSTFAAVVLNTYETYATCKTNTSARLAALTNRYCALHPRTTYRLNGSWGNGTFGSLTTSPYINLAPHYCP